MNRYTVHGQAECGAQVTAHGDTLTLAFEALDEGMREADRVSALLADPSEYEFEARNHAGELVPDDLRHLDAIQHRLAADLEPSAPARRPGIPVPPMQRGVLTHPEYV